jgi:uncharacterized membrane protein
MPGLFFTALSLLYGALSSALLYVALTQGKVYLLAWFIVATGILVIMLVMKALKVRTRTVLEDTLS